MNIREMKYGDAVKFVRMKLGLSQSELAKAIGVSLPTVSRWENGAGASDEDAWKIL